MNYDVDYFIRKFEAIPEDKWIKGVYNSRDYKQSCAFGHCGCDVTLGKSIINVPEAHSLAMLFYNVLGLSDNVPNVNDGLSIHYRQSTPKQRILAALHDIKNKLNSEQKPERSVATEPIVAPQPETKTIIKYVKVSESISEMEVVNN